MEKVKTVRISLEISEYEVVCGRAFSVAVLDGAGGLMAVSGDWSNVGMAADAAFSQFGGLDALLVRDDD